MPAIPSDHAGARARGAGAGRGAAGDARGTAAACALRRAVRGQDTSMSPDSPRPPHAPNTPTCGRGTQAACNGCSTPARSDRKTNLGPVARPASSAPARPTARCGTRSIRHTSRRVFERVRGRGCAWPRVVLRSAPTPPLGPRARRRSTYRRTQADARACGTTGVVPACRSLRLRLVLALTAAAHAPFSTSERVRPR